MLRFISQIFPAKFLILALSLLFVGTSFLWAQEEKEYSFSLFDYDEALTNPKGKNTVGNHTPAPAATSHGSAKADGDPKALGGKDHTNSDKGNVVTKSQKIA